MSRQDIIIGETPGRYAQALLELADEAGSLETVEKDMGSLKAVLEASADLQAMINTPVFADEDKVRALVAIAGKATLGKWVTNFVGTVAQNRRASQLPAMITAFQNLMSLRKGIRIARVTSAKKLTVTQTGNIGSALESALGCSVELDTSVDPSLLGGFVVRIGSKLYDNSLKTRLGNLKVALESA
ncbi:MAG: F0F1 ATP synthase subunit delta [Hyphomonadaceae bacterium]|nr:F0F1 ATP synthase subunit delta [Hyphomonadaceae bacterium]MBC6413158.1 F0F1 ATP synthase subunit delta [Hyphomonadaceae bacterium]